MRRIVSRTLATTLAAAGIAATTCAVAQDLTVTPVLTGLANPRGLALDGAGSLYVAEAGVHGGPGTGFTQSGRVSRWDGVLDPGAPSLAWSTPFTSLWNNENGADTLGPGGVAATGRGCWKNVRGERNGCQAYVIVNESRAGILEETGLDVPQLGHLYRLDGRGGAVDAGNVGDDQYAWTQANAALFPGDFPDSNPYGVAIGAGRRVYVADAGANTIVEVRDGRMRVVAYIENESAPPFRDATPTCVAEGPDGALYVGTLNLVANLFVLGPGQSRVYRVDPDTKEDPVAAGRHVWATGLTTVTSCAFDAQGRFVATEMFQPNASGVPGDVVRIAWTGPTSHGPLERFGGGSLPLPGGIAPAPDGSLFVSVVTNAAQPAAGSVVRVRAAD